MDTALSHLTPRQVAMLHTFQQHMFAEMTGDLETAMATLSDHPHVYHIPTMTGGVGYADVREFYKYHLVGKFLPPDTEILTLSRTFGEDQLVEEGVARFRHTMNIDYMLPGIQPTGRVLEVAIVAIMKFDAHGKIAHEHIYWDQASLLVQLGLLNPTGLPVKGAECVQRLVELSNVAQTAA